MTKKARFINKLTCFSLNEKKNLIDFFTANPVYESRIDWNNKNLKQDDFELVFTMSKMSVKNRKDTIKMFKDFNCKIIAHTKEFVIAVPVEWDCAIFMNSFSCGGEGAKWCIGSRHTDSHWNDNIKDGSVFYFVYFFDRHPVFGKKLMIKIDNKGGGSFYTQKDRRHDFDLLANYLRDRISTAGVAVKKKALKVW